MRHENIEIKARYSNLKNARDLLKANNAVFTGIDYQIDTYFKVNQGRLKLREGNIENFLVYYERDDIESPKKSNVLLFKTDPNSSLKEILQKSLEILVVVNKKREIYFIDNVKFHLDIVENLGFFVEIEAINGEGNFVRKRLLEQCKYYMEYLQVSKENLVSKSYSDMILNKKKNN
ncbi:MAG: class IV adenylate cyclase [Candidatus Bathyarchaeota archaeon]|nr:class IV adenylate cyclase [Candidatus Bathyarchaeota archaeon]